MAKVYRNSPNVNLQAVGHQELDRIHMPTEMKCCIPLVVCGQEVSTKLVKEAAYLHIPSCSG